MTARRDGFEWGALTLLLAIPGFASAHHGLGAQFDPDTIAELEGEVTAVVWRNPHVRFVLSVRDDAGNETVWDIEGNSLSMLRQNGISGELLAVGDSVRVAGLTSRLGRNELHVNNLLLPEGREFLLSPSAEPRWSDRVVGQSGPRYATSGVSSAGERGIFKVWTQTRVQSNLLRSVDIDAMPLTESAYAAALGYDPLVDRPSARECAPTGMPSIMNQPYPVEFVDRGATIVFRLELYDTVRTIHMDAAPPGGAQAHSMLGYSVGHWEGNTLAVTTTNVDWGSFYRGIPLSDAVEIVERFTPAQDGSRLDYTLRVIDPASFTQPVEFGKFWLYLPDVNVEPFECLAG